ncbi:MAG: hypothetical protein COA57_14675 [Flavobacteriales bacterium]|nr:MAG: hypothetical protein COA57_14675 [Flavobacteriales bacterium]
MDSIIQYFNVNALGIILFLFSILVGLFVTSRLFKLFGLGRFKNLETNGSFGYAVGVLFNKIIVEFRHLLALVIILLFAGALAYAMISGDTFSDKMDALQAVTSALGGLIGSIIGYYFGESAGRKKEDKKQVIEGREEEQGANNAGGAGGAGDIEEVGDIL